MSIDLAQKVFTNSSLLVTGVSGEKFLPIGAFWDDSTTSLYLGAIDKVDYTARWKRIDFSDEANPIAYNWSPTDKSLVYYLDSGAMGGNIGWPNRFGNAWHYDTTTGCVYQVHFRSQSNGANTGYVVKRTNLSSGVSDWFPKVFFPNESLMLADANLGSGVTANSSYWPVSPHGVVFKDGYLYVLATVQYNSSVTSDAIAKLDLTAGTWVGNLATVADGTIVTQPAQYKALPVLQKRTIGNAATYKANGMVLAADNTLLVTYQTATYAEKYDLNANLLGTTPFDPTGVQSIFSRQGYIWAITTDCDAATAVLKLVRYRDNSSNVISQQNSRYIADDRLVIVGEPTLVTLRFTAKDGWGAPMSSLAGQLCRFSIVTSRGTLDADDAALGTVADPSLFRTGNNIPVTRQVDVPFDSNGIATCYFQSARASLAAALEDTIRVTFPAA